MLRIMLALAAIGIAAAAAGAQADSQDVRQCAAHFEAVQYEDEIAQPPAYSEIAAVEPVAGGFEVVICAA